MPERLDREAEPPRKLLLRHPEFPTDRLYVNFLRDMYTEAANVCRALGVGYGLFQPRRMLSATLLVIACS